MDRRVVIAAAVAAILVSPLAVRAAAAQSVDLPANDLVASLVAPTALVSAAAVPATAPAAGLALSQLPANILSRDVSPLHTTVLRSLYLSTAVLQALDVRSTLAALDLGAREANPLMKGITSNKFTFMAVKAGVAALSITAARQVARHSKVAAIVTLVAMNTAYAAVVAHNYTVARRLQ